MSLAERDGPWAEGWGPKDNAALRERIRRGERRRAVLRAVWDGLAIGGALAVVTSFDRIVPVAHAPAVTGVSVVAFLFALVVAVFSEPGPPRDALRLLILSGGFLAGALL